MSVDRSGPREARSDTVGAPPRAVWLSGVAAAACGAVWACAHVLGRTGHHPCAAWCATVLAATTGSLVWVYAYEVWRWRHHRRGPRVMRCSDFDCWEFGVLDWRAAQALHDTIEPEDPRWPAVWQALRSHSPVLYAVSPGGRCRTEQETR